MWIHDAISEALMLIGRLQRAATAADRSEEADLWGYVREHLFFISRTGQDYRLEDHLTSLDPARTSLMSDAFLARGDEMSRQSMSLLLRTFDGTTSSREKELVLLIIDTLNFIATSGQYGDFDDYLKGYYSEAPPVIARFGTREEAEHWLNNLLEPLSWGHILIGDDYHELRFFRDTGQRKLRRDNIIELLLEDFSRKGLPSSVAAFNTREEAQEWLTRHPASPMTFVTIAGAQHLAVHHKNLGRHSLHPVAATLEKWRPRT